jgi:hypothetical protein
MKRPMAEDDLLCGLLRDLGGLILRQAFPGEYERFHAGMAERPFSAYCQYERDLFGADHAEVSADLLKRWRLPESITEPLRFHHEPERMTEAPPELMERAERLAFVEALTNLDVVAHQPAELDTLLKTAERQYGFDQAAVIEFLQGVVPKIEAFTELLSMDVGRCPDFAAILANGCQELVKLTVQSERVAVNATIRTPAPEAAPRPPAALRLPDFEPAFLDQFPETGCYLDEYELIRPLGRGAMGCVFLAWEPSLERKVAIKMMNVNDSNAEPQYQQRFLREARNAAAIRHENVVDVYAVKEVGKFSYLSMEFVEGKSLESRIADDGPLPVPMLRDIATQIAAGLAAAHAKKVIHRDVKPANILIDAATGRVKLTDFGLARAENDVRLTMDGGLIGTPLYMSPEQARGEPLDLRSDLFSLGSVLYTAATGKPPYDSTSMVQVLRMVCDAEPVLPSRLRADLPGWFDELVLRLLAKERDNRFPTADAVLEFLKGIDQPTTKKRVGWRRLFGG